MGKIDLTSEVNDDIVLDYDSNLGDAVQEHDSETPEFLDRGSETSTTIDKYAEVFDGN